MKRRSRFLAMLMAGVMALALAACSQPTTDDTETTDPIDETEAVTYVIASDTAFPPFEYMDTETNTYVGLDLDILAAIAEDQGFQYTVDHVGFDAACTAVSTGQADAAIAGMTITEERALTYDFSEGYYQNGQIMAVAADSDIAGLEDLNGLTVAAKIGTMGTQYAEANAEEYGYTIVYYEDSPTMYEAVANGTNAACFEDEAVMVYGIESGVAMKTVGESVNHQPYGIAVQKGQNAELLAMLNAGLANIKENGTYDEILAKYGL